MAAAVKVGGKNRYHVHRILMPDGSEFEFNKKTEPTGAGMTASKGGQGSAISPVSNNRVSETGKKSNEKFSMKEPVEESENLIAVHNLDETKLLKTIKLGGFAMPSIEITKSDIPQIKYEANTEVENKIKDMYYSLSNDYGSDFTRPLYDSANYLGDTLTRHGGEKGGIVYDITKTQKGLAEICVNINDRLKQKEISDGLKLIFIKENRITAILEYKKR